MVELVDVVTVVAGFALQLLGALVVVAAVLVAVERPGGVRFRRGGRWAGLVARRVVVNLHSGDAVDGLLVRVDGPLLFLRSATLHEVGADGPAPVDGEVVIERDRVAFLQFPGDDGRG